MRLIDTFAGVGGFSEGLRGVGGECVAAVEVDAEARRTFAANHPDVPLHVDMRDLDVDALPDCDLVTGGFPCQPFSRNGLWFNKNDRTVGEGDDRANLFMTLARLIHAKRPRAFLLENVKGLLSMRNPDGSMAFDSIFLTFQSLGYRVKHKVLSPHMFGMPQQRERVFLVGFREDLAEHEARFRWPEPVATTTCLQGIMDFTADPRHQAEVIWAGRTILNSPKREGAREHGLATGTSRLEALRAIYARNLEAGRVPSAPTGKVSPVAVLYGDTPSGGPRQQDKVYSRFGLCPTLTTLELVVPVVDVDPWRRLTPRECARLQGFPDAFVLPESEAVAYRQMGNAVCAEVVRYLGHALFQSGVFDA